MKNLVNSFKINVAVPFSDLLTLVFKLLTYIIGALSVKLKVSMIDVFGKWILIYC